MYAILKGIIRADSKCTEKARVVFLVGLGVDMSPMLYFTLLKASTDSDIYVIQLLRFLKNKKNVMPRDHRPSSYTITLETFYVKANSTKKANISVLHGCWLITSLMARSQHQNSPTALASTHPNDGITLP